MTNRIALVLGANGGIGGETATALATAGWQVRALARTLPATTTDGITWVRGDAMDASSVAAAATGAAVIVHAVNPPGYRDWDRLVLPMLDHTIAAATSVGARVVLPGTIYNYGPDAYPLLREESPQHPVTRKGAIRVEMEARLRASGARSLIVRAGDYFGPRAKNNWFSQGLVTPGAPVRKVTTPGADGVGHAWAYLPDVASTFAALLAREAALPAAARFHLAGHWDPDGAHMAAAIARVVGGPLPTKRLPWWLLRLASPFDVTLRELTEMRPLWRTPIELDGTALAAALGGREPRTDLDTAVRATLVGLGCLTA